MEYKTPAGKAKGIYLDTLSQPHTLIAGETGSGKSVLVNGLIYTALYKFPFDTSDSAQFILIDPRGGELVQYKYLPHTLYYASKPDTMLYALQYALGITENRYKSMQRKGLRKYDGSDIYIFIDEFADLMTTQSKAVKPLIQRLSQIGRAALVHIILATQCPLAKVIPIEIKVNFNCIWALRTATRQHSRNIMGASGCELLPRYGQGYYITPQERSIYRIPYYTDEELDERVKWWTDQKPRGLLQILFGK